MAEQPTTSSSSSSTLFERAGGLPGLRAILKTFYDAVFEDIMIGFMFQAFDKERLINKELEFAARALGARDIQYTGKPIRAAHAPHRILGGQFDRRLQLLRQAMALHDLPQPVQQAWIAHTQALRPLITPDVDSQCTD